MGGRGRGEVNGEMKGSRKRKVKESFIKMEGRNKVYLKEC